ncbi:ABC transporter ATP-binding protein [Thioalkalivibrio sp. XN8]|uniref:ABC transporter ATP-binding protein n=1 Tax=Thioalkalivibrio sp. XN8 TaxID=2712863 RepID=UPI0013EC2819|nr:ABC transporter ATP-binding protein [Thioalkalivibrio sp. XN8]NGP52561.1 ABC transporter ATP-binding protein [Thioalkalivibrio sp. XN8]
MKALELENLSKTYPNGVRALDGIDLAVDEGDFFALLGPNGAGKSTTIGIVTSLVTKTGGTARIFGHDIDRDFSAAKACIGLVPQELNLNQFEKVESIVATQGGYYGLGRRQALARAEKYLRELQLWDRRHDIARSLSGGMKRRLMIARALVHEPKLLILDEPTAGVDIEIRRSMWAFLRQVNEAGTTIILTTHYLEEAENLCRNVAIIDHGRIIEHDRMSRVLRKLHMETFVLTMDREHAAPPALDGYTSRLVDPLTLEVDVESQHGINELFQSLSAAGIKVTSMRNKANRLEELFIRLVDQGGDGRAA